MASEALEIATEDGLDIIVREDNAKAIWQEWKLDTVRIEAKALEIGTVLGLEPAQLIARPYEIAEVRVFLLRELVAVDVEVTPEELGTILPIEGTPVILDPKDVLPMAPLEAVPVLLTPDQADLLLVPSAPGGFTAKRVNDFSETNLSWSSSFGAADYVIYRNDHQRAAYYLHATTTNTSYTDVLTDATQNHGYKVAARSSAGVLSRFSDAIHTSGKNANL